MTATPIPLVVWAALLLGVATIDAGAYLVAASRAQGAADAAALAAVSGDPGRPASSAAQVADANRGRLDTCRCRPSSGRAEVVVSVEVGGLFVPRVNGMQRVSARAEALLTHARAPEVGHHTTARGGP